MGNVSTRSALMRERGSAKRLALAQQRAQADANEQAAKALKAAERAAAAAEAARAIKEAAVRAEAAETAAAEAAPPRARLGGLGGSGRLQLRGTPRATGLTPFVEGSKVVVKRSTGEDDIGIISAYDAVKRVYLVSLPDGAQKTCLHTHLRAAPFDPNTSVLVKRSNGEEAMGTIVSYDAKEGGPGGGKGVYVVSFPDGMQKQCREGAAGGVRLNPFPIGRKVIVKRSSGEETLGTVQAYDSKPAAGSGVKGGIYTVALADGSQKMCLEKDMKTVKTAANNTGGGANGNGATAVSAAVAANERKPSVVKFGQADSSGMLEV